MIFKKYFNSAMRKGEGSAQPHSAVATDFDRINATEFFTFRFIHQPEMAVDKFA